MLYELSAADEQALDQWDGASLGYYRKTKVRVATLDGDVVAWLYVLNDYEGGLPSPATWASWRTPRRRPGRPPTTWRVRCEARGPAA